MDPVKFDFQYEQYDYKALAHNLTTEVKSTKVSTTNLELLMMRLLLLTAGKFKVLLIIY